MAQALGGNPSRLNDVANGQQARADVAFRMNLRTSMNRRGVRLQQERRKIERDIMVSEHVSKSAPQLRPSAVEVARECVQTHALSISQPLAARAIGSL